MSDPEYLNMVLSFETDTFARGDAAASFVDMVRKEDEEREKHRVRTSLNRGLHAVTSERSKNR